MERVASGGIISGLASAEGLVCKFTGKSTAPLFPHLITQILKEIRPRNRLHADQEPECVCGVGRTECGRWSGLEAPGRDSGRVIGGTSPRNST